jgi:hypothetical protein
MFMRKGVILSALILVGLVCVYAADITGKWTTQFDSQVGVQKYIFEFKVEGTKLTGTAISKVADAAEVKTPITEGAINGEDITFVENLDYSGQALKISYKGKLAGDEIKFTRDVAGQGGETFVAKKAK